MKIYKIKKIILTILLSLLLAACGDVTHSSKNRESIDKTTSDTTPPVITLKGGNPIKVVQNQLYIDAGAEAIDNNDGLVEVRKSGHVDTSKIGSYAIIYRAKDGAGNTATKSRTVKVVANKPINNTPTISFTNSKSIYSPNETISVKVDNAPKLTNSKSWFGIYELGERSTFEHMVYYQFADKAAFDGTLYLTETNPESKEALERYKNLKEDTAYELRRVAMVNGKFVTYSNKEITIHPHHIQQVSDWIPRGINATPHPDLDDPSGDLPLKITNNKKGQSEWVGDDIPINNAKVITFSAKSRSENVSAGALYALDFKITFSDGTDTWYYDDTKFDIGTHDWQEVQVTHEFDKPVVSVTPYAILYKETGKAWFKDVYVHEGNSIPDSIKNAYYINTVSIQIDDEAKYSNPGPWVGIYELGEPSTFEHMVYYQYLDTLAKNGTLNLIKIKPESKEALSRYKNIKENTKYELRLVALVNGEYVTYAKKDITIEPLKYRDEIHQAFNKYYEEYKKVIPLNLTKDEDGNSDTYVLYNLQMYLQSAIIYADENDDTEIIEKMLELVKIPFKKEYMTDGKWLNNQYQPGEEMELPISQYFSLLTRVLSTAQRHNIDAGLTQREHNIIIEHIDRWINTSSAKYNEGIDDVHLFFNQSAMQFYDYAKRKGVDIPNIKAWRQYIQDYKKFTFDKFTQKDKCISNPKEKNCIVLSRLKMRSKYQDYLYSGYGAETTSDMMFDEDGMVKLPSKALKVISTDISHARRFNWYFETVKRFGAPFNIRVSDDILQGWANNLAYRVCRGDTNNPHFTIFSDGQDGWYRVNYDGGSGTPRPFFGYPPGDMDIDFVSGSYAMFGVYNPKIYTWIDNWIKKDESFLTTNYYSGRVLDYYTSKIVNIKNNLVN